DAVENPDVLEQHAHRRRLLRSGNGQRPDQSESCAQKRSVRAMHRISFPAGAGDDQRRTRDGRHDGWSEVARNERSVWRMRVPPTLDEGPPGVRSADPLAVRAGVTPQAGRSRQRGFTRRGRVLLPITCPLPEPYLDRFCSLNFLLSRLVPAMQNHNLAHNAYGEA